MPDIFFSRHCIYTLGDRVAHLSDKDKQYIVNLTETLWRKAGLPLDRLKGVKFNRTNTQNNTALCRYWFEQDAKDASIKNVIFRIEFNEHKLTANVKNLRNEGIKSIILHEIMHAKDIYTDLERAYRIYQQMRHKSETLSQTREPNGIDLDDDHDEVFQNLVNRYGQKLNIDMSDATGPTSVMVNNRAYAKHQHKSIALAPAHITDVVVYICPRCGTVDVGYTFRRRCMQCGNTDTIYANIPPSEVAQFVKLLNLAIDREKNLYEFYKKYLIKYTRGPMRKRFYEFLKNEPDIYQYPELVDALYRERSGRTVPPPMDRVAKIARGIDVITKPMRRFKI